jgi:single-stranded-DNA-specific exonuclease
MKWEKPQVAADEVRELSSAYNIDLLSAAILARRGVTDSSDIVYFLEDDPAYLHSPFLFDEMEDAVDRILMAKAEGEKVLVFGDRDVDGITSTVLMVNTLREMGIDVSWAVPMGDDPYGLTTEVVETYAAKDVTLIITVDCGTTNHAEIERAVELGMDTIVVDHHNPREELPSAVAIINPKLPDSPYPFDGLAGCGVVSKLRWALNFALTDFYKQPVVLLNARPGNETVILEALKLENLVEVDRITESLVPGVARPSDARVVSFVQGHEVLGYDVDAQESLIRQVFGNSVEVNLLDLAPKIWEAFPRLRDKSLLRMRDASRLAKYAKTSPGELDVFRALFLAFVAASEPSLEARYVETVDLVALGTLADMMPLVNENRILVRRGLQRISKHPRPGLRKLLEKQNILGKTISSTDVGFQLSPVINATGRLGKPDKAVRLLLADEAGEAPETEDLNELAGTVVDLNSERRRIGDEAWDLIQEPARRSFDETKGRLVIVVDRRIYRGVTGIIAGRLARTFNAPSVVVTESDGKGIGSIRSARGFGATEFLAALADLLQEWGGHNEAAGFSLPLEGIDTFLARARETAAAMPLDDGAEAVIPVDAELPPDYLKPEIEEVVSRFAPFGQANPPLRFMARDLRLQDVRFIGKGDQHLRFLVDTGRYKWPAVYWNAADRYNRDFTQDDRVDLLFEFQKNFYQNRETPQLHIIDLRRSGSGSTRSGSTGTGGNGSSSARSGNGREDKTTRS